MKVIGLPTQQAPRKKWTVLCYMDGKNNLSKMIERSAKSLEKVGSDDNVNIVAEIGLAGMDEVRRGELTRGQGMAQLHSVGSQDMGCASTLQEFVEWGMRAYPAEHYAVIVADHGAGFRGACNDDEYGSLIENEAMADALEAAQKRAGGQIDVLAFDCCLMAQAEVGYALRNSAKYMVASEETEAGFMVPIPGMNGGMPLARITEGLQKANGDLSGEELSRLFVYEAGRQLGRTNFTPTQSAVELSRMQPVRNASERLAGALLQEMASDPGVADRLRAVIGKTQNYSRVAGHVKPYADYRDMGDFSKRVAREFEDKPRVAVAAQGLQAELARSVLAETHSVASSGVSMFGSTGMSVYLPTNYGLDPEQDRRNWGYHKTEFAQGSQWEQMLETISQPEPAGLPIPSGSNPALKFMRTVGRYELPLMANAGMAVGPIGLGLALLAGVDSFYRVKEGAELIKHGAESLGTKGAGSAILQGALTTTAGALTGAAAVSMLMGNPQAAMALGGLSLGLDLAVGGAKLAGALGRKAVDAFRSPEEKIEATYGKEFQPALGPLPAPAAGLKQAA